MEIQKSSPKINRVPRPAGTTFLSIEYNKEQSTTNKERILSHIIYYYTSSGFRWNNKPLSLPQFSQMIGTPTSTIMEYISKSGQQMGSLISPENLRSTIESIITLSASWAIQDRGQIQKQVEDLLRSQGGRYMPFVTAEVNKALKLTLDSNKNLMETVKSLITNNQTNILNIFNQGQTNQDQELLTPATAIQLISNANKEQKALSVQASGNIAQLPDQKLQELYQEWEIGDSETVRENGLERKPYSPETMSSPKASELRESPHDNVSRRRGEEVVDYDDLPDRA